MSSVFSVSPFFIIREIIGAINPFLKKSFHDKSDIFRHHKLYKFFLGDRL